MNAQFLLAKYVPEVHRMEPRNVGVVVWYRGRAEGRFIDERSAPFLLDPVDYREHVDEWKSMVAQGRIDGRGGESVSIDSPEFLAALRRTSHEQYFFVDAGFLTEKISVRELPHVADFLYSDLVDTSHVRQAPRGDTFDVACKRLLSDSGLASRVVKGFQVQCDVYGVRKPLKFSYGAGDDMRPNGVLQRVTLDREASVHDAALKIKCLTSDHKLEPHQCGIIVMAPPESARSELECENLEILSRLGAIIDLARFEDAVDVARAVFPPTIAV